MSCEAVQKAAHMSSRACGASRRISLQLPDLRRSFDCCAHLRFAPESALRAPPRMTHVGFLGSLVGGVADVESAPRRGRKSYNMQCDSGQRWQEKLMRERWKYKKPVAVVTSIALALSLAVAPGVASARVAQDGLAVGAMAISDVPEWAVDDGSNASALTAQSAPAKQV